MQRPKTHTDDSAIETMEGIEFERACKRRRDRKKRTLRQHKWFCTNKPRLHNILTALRQPNFNMAEIARHHDTPHHTIVYIYTTYIMGDQK